MEPGRLHYPIDRRFRAARLLAAENHLPGCQGPPLHFDSVLPPNRLEYLVTLAMNTKDCNPELANSGIRGDISGGQAFLRLSHFP